MKIAVTIARILLGLLFTFAGVAGFIIINNPPPVPGLAGEFQHVFFTSRWVLFVDTIQALAGLMLLTGRFVPLALTLLGAVFYNIFAFHITMQPATIPFPIIAFALWCFVAWNYRSYLAPLFVMKATMSTPGDKPELAHA